MFGRDGGAQWLRPSFGKSDCEKAEDAELLTPEKNWRKTRRVMGTLRKRRRHFSLIAKSKARHNPRRSALIKIKLADAGATCGTNWMELAPVPTTATFLPAKSTL